MNKKVMGILLTVIATFLWGLLVIPTRKLGDDGGFGLSSMDIAFLRMGLTAVGLFIVLFIFDRKSLKFKWRDFWIFPVFGFMEMLAEIFIFYAMGHISASLAVLLQMTSPYYIMLMAYFIFGEKITKRMAIASIIAVTGCVFATGVILGIDTVEVYGIIAGIGSGFAYAAFVIGSRVGMERQYSPQGMLFYTFLFGAIFLIPTVNFDMVSSAFLSDDLSIPALILSMSIFMTLVPYFFANVAIRDIGVSLTSIIELFEIIFAGLTAFVVFGEEITLLNAIGMILIFVAMIVFDEESYNYTLKKLKGLLKIFKKPSS